MCGIVATWQGSASASNIEHEIDLVRAAGERILNLQRLDLMTMAHGLEGRVPFLDVEFLERATSLDPELKVHRRGRLEKWPRRAAFDGVLPDAILWRRKLEFGQGCGSEWTLREHCEAIVSDTDFAAAARRFPRRYAPNQGSVSLPTALRRTVFGRVAAPDGRSLARYLHPARGRT